MQHFGYDTRVFYSSAGIDYTTKIEKKIAS